MMNAGAAELKLIARIEEIPVWGLKFSYTAGKLSSEGILLRLASGEIKAYKNECRHLPMPLDEREPHTYWDPGCEQPHCSSHGARFRVEDGLCTSGPCAGEHLISIPVTLVDGQVAIELAETE